MKDDPNSPPIQQIIEAAIRDLIEHEAADAPLSDDALTGELARRGIDVSRRMVTKCRQKLGIPSTRQRSADQEIVNEQFQIRAVKQNLLFADRNLN